ncbi:UNKNOWN [Stylonychia lemnae]|uniref:Transmembrane protein n=1 Tax=Stylonychia lemnae TaxID=5949 RepID=A0A078B2W2_STYLE|nr:UNKNOWN [Stylonychia lemnae]|eukprot:CDW87848.1 UNKNOWN [Stylonychia lemnae]
MNNPRKAKQKLKNKIPRYNLNLEPVPNKYHPENERYVEGLVFMVVVIIFTSLVIGVAFILFTVCRVACKRCQGDIEDSESFNPDGKGNYVCGLVFLTLYFTAVSTILIIGNVGYFNNSLDSNELISTFANQMQTNVQTLKSNLITLNDAQLQDYIQKYGVKMSFDINSLNNNVIPEAQNILTQSEGNADKMKSLEIGVFVWVFITFGFGLLFIILSCISLSKNWQRVALFNGIFSFFIIATTVSLVAMKHGQLIYMVDFCEQMIQISEEGQLPTIGTGISKYLSCLSQDSSSIVTTLGYQGSIEYQKGIILSNEKLQQLGSPNVIYTLPDLVNVMSNNATLSIDNTLKNWASTLDQISQTNQLVSDLTSCQILQQYAKRQNNEYCSDGYFYMWFVYSGVIAITFYYIFMALLSVKMNIYLNQLINYDATNYPQQNSFEIDKMGNVGSNDYLGERSRVNYSGKQKYTSQDLDNEEEVDSLVKKPRKYNNNDLSFSNNAGSSTARKSKVLDTFAKTMDYTGKNTELDLTKENSATSKRGKKGHQKQQSYDQDDDFDMGKSSDSIEVTDNEIGRPSLFDARDISTIKKKDKKQKTKQKRDSSYDY